MVCAGCCSMIILPTKGQADLALLVGAQTQCANTTPPLSRLGMPVSAPHLVWLRTLPETLTSLDRRNLLGRLPSSFCLHGAHRCITTPGATKASPHDRSCLIMPRHSDGFQRRDPAGSQVGTCANKYLLGLGTSQRFSACSTCSAYH